MIFVQRPNWVSLWTVSAFNGVSSVPAVAEIAPQMGFISSRGLRANLAFWG